MMTFMRFVPTLEQARVERTRLRAPIWWGLGERDLLEEEPTSIERLAVVVVRAVVHSRETWVRESDLPVRFASQPPMSEPPAAKPFRERSHRVFVGIVANERKRCTLCGVRRGLGPCGRCTGTGKVIQTKTDDGVGVAVDCKACADGFVTCTQCEGTGEVVVGRIRYVEDRSTKLRYAYVPTMSATLERAVESMLDESVEPPPSLQIDLAPREVRSAYRGAVAREEPTFHQHRFGDALERARAGVATLPSGASVVHRDVRAFAWPLLLLRFGGIGRPREAVLVVAPRGRLTGYVAPEG